MRIPDDLLNKYSDGLEFKRFFKNDDKTTTYAIYREDNFEGVFSFRDYGLSSKGNDSNINVFSLLIETVKSGLATKILDIACKCGEEMGAEQVVIIQPLKEETIAYDAKGRKRTYTKRKRIKIYKKIGKRLKKETCYDKDRNVVTYTL